MNTFANSVNPDEKTRYDPSHQVLHCLLLFFISSRLPCLHKWTCLNLITEMSTSETQKYKEYFQNLNKKKPTFGLSILCIIHVHIIVGI